MDWSEICKQPDETISSNELRPAKQILVEMNVWNVAGISKLVETWQIHFSLMMNQDEVREYLE